MKSSQIYPKRLIEVDLPIKRISTHARREKSIRHGHISTLHIWWARRPLAACRAVICASLWPDPADPNCPEGFIKTAKKQMLQWATHERLRILSAESQPRFNAARKKPELFDKKEELRGALLDFIADFSNWDNSTTHEYLDTSRTLTQAAHEALGGEPGTIPLVVDPFAGGGSIPLEALRVGADTFASDLNPIPVLLNKVILEYIPKYGQRLTDEVYKWGEWIKMEAEKELAEFYPKDPDGATPIAYLWARTLICEGPGCGVEVPMINQMWIKKNGTPKYAYEYDVKNKKEIKLNIVENPSLNKVVAGTSKQGSVTCPCCGFTTAAERVRLQARSKGLGIKLLGVVLSLKEGGGRRFRIPNKKDFYAIESANKKLKELENNAAFSQNLKVNVPLTELRRISVPLYGVNTFDNMFLPRQRLAFGIIEIALKKLLKEKEKANSEKEFTKAVATLLSLSISSALHYNMNLSTYLSNGMVSAFIQGTSLAMRSDFAEANPLMAKLVGGIQFSLTQLAKMLEKNTSLNLKPGSANKFSATSIGLPDDSASLVVTDPPYYDSVPYSHLSDVFYIWLKSTIGELYASYFESQLTNKEEEIVEDRAHSKSPSKKRADFYEHSLMEAFKEIRRTLEKDSLLILVFAHKSTRGWESMLNGLLAAEWTIVGSWPIDTERPERMNAHQNASLLSSVHVACRPRKSDSVGDWREVLHELPRRIHEWMPRLAEEGVVGADAIFACLGPALEIFSRYSRVEKASGESVTLKEYLEQVWAAVANEALSVIFSSAQAEGFDPEARLTAMWLWTLSARPQGQEAEDNENLDEADDPKSNSKAKPVGFNLEYDAARKIAQGLGVNLEALEHLVEIDGSTARLLSVSERAKYLFGESEDEDVQSNKRKKKSNQQELFFLGNEEEKSKSDNNDTAFKPGATVLDRVHQSMLLFGAGRSGALKRLLVDDGTGADARFWRLAQALSALYPSSTDEKRWIDGVLARKKGLGF